MHVPPGMDSYGEANGSGAAGHQWRNDKTGPGNFLDRFLALIARDPQRVQVSFAGHTHMDDFRIDLDPSKQPMLLHKIVPSVSPINGNNPSFQVYTCNRGKGDLQNYHAFYLPIQPVAKPTAPSVPAAAPSWQPEYDFAGKYGASVINAQSVATLFGEIKTNPNGSKAKSYAKYYRSAASDIAPKHLMIYVCAILNATYSDYENCYRSATQRKPPPFLADSDLLRHRAAGLGK
jgi:sphingomyelin phosphodiesterase acid-like 3